MLQLRWRGLNDLSLLLAYENINNVLWSWSNAGYEAAVAPKQSNRSQYKRIPTWVPYFMKSCSGSIMSTMCLLVAKPVSLLASPGLNLKIFPFL